MFIYNPKLKKLARTLRKNMTETEVKLWCRLKGKQINGIQFYRQRPLGNYIVDFYCPLARLVIEIDGSQHYEEKGRKKDIERDKYLSDILKLKILRFNNIEVLKDIEGVLEKVCLEVTDRVKSPQPPLKKGEHLKGRF